TKAIGGQIWDTTTSGTLIPVNTAPDLDIGIRVCSNHHGLIRKYGLNICRRCFRQYADQIGFKKLD
ncbi:unnamed protein product, partial [Oppiella nova]